MNLYIVRHGDAVELPPQGQDADRSLSERGFKEMRLVGEGLRRLGVQVDVILTSPYLRARQSAELIASALGKEGQVQARDELAPGCDLSRLRAALSSFADVGSVMVVGHQPDCGAIVDELCSLSGTPMKKGAVAFINLRGELAPGGGSLVWLKEPKDLIASCAD